MAPARPRRNSPSRRPYIRKPTNNAPSIVPPTSPPQIPDLAFNIHGWALEDGMARQGRRLFEVINAYKATMVKGGFDAKVQELRREAMGEIYREDLTYTQRELDPHLSLTDPAIAQYLVVGYTLQEEDPVFMANKSFARYSENELVGETPPQPGNMISWHQVRTPILVVTPIKENTGTSVRLFGLIMPRSDLCQPVLLTHERIFYRWEFRASAGARATQRNKYWNQIVIDKARELMSPEMVRKMEEELQRSATRRCETRPSVKRESFGEIQVNTFDSPDPDEHNVFSVTLDLDKLFESASEAGVSSAAQSKFQVKTDVKLRLSPDTDAIITLLRDSQDSSRLHHELRTHLQRSELKSTLPPYQNAVLNNFFMLEVPLDIDESRTVASEIQNTWPLFGHLVTDNALLHMKHVMVENGLTIPSAMFMEDFFRIMLSYFAMYPNMGDPEVLFRLGDAIHMSQILGVSPLRLESSDTGLNADAVFMLMLLQELFSIHKLQRSGMMNNMQMASMVKLRATHYLGIDLDHGEQGLLDAVDFLREHVHVVGKKNNAEDIMVWFERLQNVIRHGRRV